MFISWTDPTALKTIFSAWFSYLINVLCKLSIIKLFRSFNFGFNNSTNESNWISKKQLSPVGFPLDWFFSDDPWLFLSFIGLFLSFFVGLAVKTKLIFSSNLSYSLSNYNSKITIGTLKCNILEIPSFSRLSSNDIALTSDIDEKAVSIVSFISVAIELEFSIKASMISRSMLYTGIDNTMPAWFAPPK